MLLLMFSTIILQDFSKEYMEKFGHGIYIPIDISLLPPLYLIYTENPSDSGKVSIIKWILLSFILLLPH